MSKIIRMTEEEIVRLSQEFADALRNMKMSDGKVSYHKDFGKIEKKAVVYYTEIAWLKQCMLVNEFDKEVAWHGIVKRGDEPGNFIIEDILVYPQEVTGSNVETDQVKYQTWLYEWPDEIFNNIRFQGHSHVNMTTSPSSVDTKFYDGILEQLNGTSFYIFGIWNKRGEKTIKIYDLQENVLYETADIDIQIIDEGQGFSDFISDAKAMVQPKTYYAPAKTPVTPKNAGSEVDNSGLKKGKKKNYGYGGYYE